MNKSRIGRLGFVVLCSILTGWLFYSLFPPYVEDLFHKITELNTPKQEQNIGERKLERNGGSSDLPEKKTLENSDAGSDIEGNSDDGQDQPLVGNESDHSGDQAQDTNLEDETEENNSDLTLDENSKQVPTTTNGSITDIKANDLEISDEIVGPPDSSLAVTILGLIVGAWLGSLLLALWEKFLDHWKKLPSGSRLTIIIGSLIGIIAGIVISIPFQFYYQGKVASTLITVSLILGCGATLVYSLRAMSDYLPWETGVVSNRKTGVKILDTNVLIDGRIYDLIRAGFIDGEIYLPRFVLQELQHIADNADSLKRQRGRRGLDVLRRIQSEFDVEVGKRDKYAGSQRTEVDLKLIKLAKALGGDLVSNDYNLNKVATIEGVRVLNINELALALRPTVLPGESLEIQLIKEGSQHGQGVGYLDDGTMVVVDRGDAHLGETVSVDVTQVIQTERGKMIFADFGQTLSEQDGDE